MKATSVKKSNCSTPLISKRQTCDKGLPVRRPTSLSKILFKNPFVSIKPFMYISALPSLTSLTAVRAASVVSSTLIISKPSKSISISAAISLIFSSSPTKIALAMLRSFAAFTASSTGVSCATATATVFISHFAT